MNDTKIKREYDQAGLLTKEENEMGGTITYSYNEINKVKQMN